MSVLQVELPLEVSEDEARLLLAIKLYDCICLASLDRVS
jgi:hypothetical protein